MSGHHSSQAAHEPAGTTKLFLMVWVWLVALTGIEVWLAYIHLEPTLMLVLLLGLSVAKAAMIVAYFMHLRFERLSLTLWIIPALVFCICMMAVFFPDSIRALQMRP